jgi:1-acyl-sn-glycerol-3-phosphate acyltransferase
MNETVSSFPRAFRPSVDPERVRRHNRGIGSRLQRAATRLFMIYFLGALNALVLRILFRLEVVRLAPIRSLEARVVFACRHFYEWDPLISLTALAWKSALTRPDRLPYIVAGDFWFRRSVLRAMLWLLNILCLVRDHEPENGAMSALRDLLLYNSRGTALIFPTGPIGRSTQYRVKPGIGWLAQECHEIQILPVTTIGVQQICLRDVLLLRRPRLTVVTGAPFRGREVEGGTREDRELAVCERVDEQWQAMEYWVKWRDGRHDHVCEMPAPQGDPAVAPSQG